MTECKIHKTQYESNCGGQQKHVKFAKISHLPKWPATTGIWQHWGFDICILQILLSPFKSHAQQKTKNINWSTSKVSNMYIFYSKQSCKRLSCCLTWLSTDNTRRRYWLNGRTRQKTRMDPLRSSTMLWSLSTVSTRKKTMGISGHGHMKKEIWGGKIRTIPYNAYIKTKGRRGIWCLISWSKTPSSIKKQDAYQLIFHRLTSDHPSHQTSNIKHWLLIKSPCARPPTESICFPQRHRWNKWCLCVENGASPFEFGVPL